MYENLKVTAHLQCGVVTDETLPLDSILYYYAMRDAFGPQELTVPGGHLKDVVPLQVKSPFKVINPGTPQWFNAASFAQWSTPCVEGDDHWNKRFDQSQAHLIDFKGRRGRVIIEQSRYKSYHMPVYYRHALSVSWYVVADAERIRALLRFVTHIGKKPAQGWGAVLRWEVEPWRADWSVKDGDGRLMRAVPIGSPEPGRVYERMMFVGFRPSYWDRRNQAMCCVPG
jgi:hypothetical protein